MAVVNMTIKTLVTATDPGHHPAITADIADFPYLNSPRVVILSGNDLSNDTVIAATAIALAVTNMS